MQRQTLRSSSALTQTPCVKVQQSPSPAHQLLREPRCPGHWALTPSRKEMSDVPLKGSGGSLSLGFFTNGDTIQIPVTSGTDGTYTCTARTADNGVMVSTNYTVVVEPFQRMFELLVTNYTIILVCTLQPIHTHTHRVLYRIYHPGKGGASVRILNFTVD